MVRLIHGDCNTFMRDVPDKAYDLSIVDPPYGIGDKFKGGKTGKMNFNEIVNKEWDSVPTDEYFNELERVSKNRIIWGGNYFKLPPTRCFIVWDKMNAEGFSLAMCEMAWTSFDEVAKIFKKSNHSDKIHPTQKPVQLYKWLLKNYAKEGDKILDTHGGSMSSVIACIDGGFDMTCIELDDDYFKAGVQRVQNHVRQLDMFIERPEIQILNC